MAPTLVWHHIGNTGRQTIFIILISMVLGAAVNLPWHDINNYFETVIMTLDPEALTITYCDGGGKKDSFHG